MRLTKPLLGLSQLPFVALAASSSSQQDAPHVNLGSSKVIGFRHPVSQQEFFGGIPFAEPPVGNLRFKPPVAKESLSDGVFNATEYGPVCLQDISWLGGLPMPYPLSEDCLTINVLRPANTPASAKLPVMVWSYGGGFEGGAAPFYNGTRIVSQSVSRGTPVIFVTFNYRLGALGFPLGNEAHNAGALNLGLKDQRLALKWVQDNIDAFGGDKHKVIAFGESAGAISFATLMLDPSFENLARGVILQSGSAASISNTFNATVPNKNLDWANFVSGVPDCAPRANTTETFECLRGVQNKTALVQAWAMASQMSVSGIPWVPTLDGDAEDSVFPDLPSVLFKTGKTAKIPFIAGTNLDEGTLFTSQERNYTSDEIRASLINQLTPSLVSEEELDGVITRLLELYPGDPELGSPFGSGDDTFGLSPGYKRNSAITGDQVFQSTRRALSSYAADSGVKSWAYLFADPMVEPTLGVNHGADIAYIFSALNNTVPGNLALGEPKDLSAALELSTTMIDYWMSFAVHMDPNDGKGEQKLEWPAYSKDKMFQGSGTTEISDAFREAPIAWLLENAIAFRR